LRLDPLEDLFRLYRYHTIMNCTQTLSHGSQPGEGDRGDQEAAGPAAL